MGGGEVLGSKVRYEFTGENIEYENTDYSSYETVFDSYSIVIVGTDEDPSLLNY